MNKQIDEVNDFLGLMDDGTDNIDFWEYVNKIKKDNDEYLKMNGKKRKALIMTFGCQMNEHDSEKIGWILEKMDYDKTDVQEEADLIIYNTCAIRENAELKVYGHIGALKKIKGEKEDLMIALCGCMMQREEVRKIIKEKHRHVDLIFGTNNIHKIPRLLDRVKNESKMVIDIDDSTAEVIEGINSNRLYDYKAFVNIMYGCNNFCTYCIVPFTRGREISRRPADILEEIKDLAAHGTKEITLLGQNVNSYGKSLKLDYDFSDLLKDIDEIDGIERIRFMTSHPRDISDKLIEQFGQLNNLSNHLHLPVQSGSNRILKEMNRHYNREDYLKSVEKLRNIRPDIALSTDIIIGFPGETDEDFEATLSLIKEVEYDFAYTFLYSKREGTKAANMENQVPEEVKHQRFDRLVEEINKISFKKNKRLENTVVKVLVEEINKADASMVTGRTEEFKIVHFKGDKNLIGKIVDVRIDHVKTFSMEGSICD